LKEIATGVLGNELLLEKKRNWLQAPTFTSIIYISTSKLAFPIDLEGNKKYF